MPSLPLRWGFAIEPGAVLGAVFSHSLAQPFSMRWILQHRGHGVRGLGYLEQVTGDHRVFDDHDLRRRDAGDSQGILPHAFGDRDDNLDTGIEEVDGKTPQAHAPGGFVGQGQKI
jgi:hypothetical protein